MERVLVVGGGLLGCAVALELARRKVEVVVLERAVVGAEASSAAAGILAPRLEAHGEEPMRSVGIESLGMYPAWAASLGRDIGLVHSGLLRVVLAGERVDSPDVDAVWVDDVHALEPTLSKDAVGGWWLPDEATVDTRKLVPAVHAAAEEAGAAFRVGVPVSAVHADGVELEGGAHLRGRVIACAGAWTGQVPGLRALPVRPVRGQLAGLVGVGMRRVVFGTGGYLVPREGGRVVCGTTVEEVGFARGVTAAGLRHVLDTAMRIAPPLGAAAVEATWSGFRPGTPDTLPMLGAVDGVWVASGHYRNGILHAPFTATRMAAAVLDGAPLPAAFSPARFVSTEA